MEFIDGRSLAMAALMAVLPGFVAYAQGGDAYAQGGDAYAQGGGAYAQEQDAYQVRGVQNLTRGIRYAGRHVAIAQSKTDPNYLYMGTIRGRVHASSDGGQSWHEANALTARGRAYGAIRPLSPPGGVIRGSVGMAPVSLGRAAGFVLPSRFTASAIDQGGAETVGANVEADLFSDDPSDARSLTAFESGRRAYPQQEAGSLFKSLVYTRSSGSEDEGGGDDNSLAIGLRARAPWLAYQVRRKRRWAIGVGLKQGLVLKGGGRTSILHLDIHPQRPHEVLAATQDGLRLSTDGGYSWPLVLTGATARERTVYHVVRSPHDSALIYAGLGNGLSRSRDGGRTWLKVLDRFVDNRGTTWIGFHPRDPETLYVGSYSGLAESNNGGRDFRRTYYSPWPTLRWVRQVEVDPHESQKIWMGTGDGLLVSEDGGKHFERSGGLLFTGSYIVRFAFGKEPGHLMVGTVRDLWETRDGGRTWQVALFGAIEWDIRHLVPWEGPEGGFLVLTTAEVLHYGPMPQSAIGQGAVEAFRDLVAKEPARDELLTAALRRFGIYRPDIMSYRQRSRWSGMMPRIDAVFGAGRYGFDRNFRNLAFDPGRVLRARTSRTGPGHPFKFFANMSWSLDDLVVSAEETIVKRVARQNVYGERMIRMTVIMLSQERKRLQFEGLIARSSPRADLLRNLRLEELTAHLNALTGNLLEPHPAL